jgi:putative hydrolase of the HAD superfamily
MSITTIGLDADDTLWHNETIFRLTHRRFTDLLAGFADEATVLARLAVIEHRNLGAYGYGVKGFVLSMIETAVDLSRGKVSAAVIGEILNAGHDMLAHPVEALPGVEATLRGLAPRYRLVLITKGDLIHQESKLAASGLGDLFHGVEIVSEKDVSTYRRAFERHGAGPADAAMVGNSMKSDILPALEAGAWAAYIPYHITWAHELAEPPVDHPRFTELASIGELPAWVDGLA